VLLAFSVFTPVIYLWLVISLSFDGLLTTKHSKFVQIT